MKTLRDKAVEYYGEMVVDLYCAIIVICVIAIVGGRVVTAIMLVARSIAHSSPAPGL